ncbi:hypothetical protein NQ315_017255 [Exocentrus adspersus]|uniref:S1 motif domain-containing protein n=1 Tax=Exocentrus adspersus TaxID=1586481 RepID=A0AAV8VFR3_9CUCU|nr:hypothetical protein NQ315_017255 [Exocentrus adspersus]
MDPTDLIMNIEESGSSKSKPVQKRKIKGEPKEKVLKKRKITQEYENGECEERPRKQNVKVKSDGGDIDITPLWTDYELLSEQKSLEINIAKNVIDLFIDGNTIPFIARYRKNQTGNMSAELLREVKDSFDRICQLKAKMRTSINTVNKQGQLNSQLEKAMRSVKSLEELEIIYAAFKPDGKRTLAARAKELGLEGPAMNLLNNLDIELNNYINLEVKELSTIEDVEKGITHIIAHVIATDTEILSQLRKLRTTVNFMLEVKKSNTKSESKIKTSSKKTTNKPVDESKFENYFDYKVPIKYIKPHQILAINRGENQKILSVKIVVPDYVLHKFSQFCENKWLKKETFNPYRQRIIGEAIKDSYNRLVQPLIVREIRAELKHNAEKASFEVFSTNLKHLLLAAPLKGKSILAIDPGYSNGCKLALVSNTGSLLSYNVIYLHKCKKPTNNAADILKNMLQEHACTLIALGNGTACRETEQWLTALIEGKVFYPLDVSYTIVNEDGASIYSCSPEAKKEFSDLDTNIISAARRIQDPLAELVKVEPQHLGVGMYQHDLKKKQLEDTLNEVVSECVSFVGVDLNTASQCLLRRIAGLTEKRAANIINYREKNGPFLYRKQLTDVPGIGARVFEQCAGFLRVGPTSASESEDFYKNAKTTKLDCTYVHPESYDVTNKILKKLKLKADDIGESHFIDVVKSTNFSLSELKQELKCSAETISLILETLAKPLNYDLRCEVSDVPLFRKGLTSIYDINSGTVVTGRVKNVTHFGSFVDIGVGTDGLIHNSKLNGCNLQIGDRVEAKVLSIDVQRRRIGLATVKKL